MKKLILKSMLYMFLILILLELLVRVFYLGKDTPSRFLDEYQVEKWVPNQQGISVTGNRRQNFSKYYINKSGYNSYREFTPTKDKIEIAIVGDSYIQGFHQDYHNSIGKKIEKIIPEVEVYEYGYAGYDFADQLHLIYSYKKQFELIDHVILGIKFSNDLTRGEYKVIQERLQLESSMNRLLRKSKLLVYCKSIGILDPPKQLVRRVLSILKPAKAPSAKNKKEDQKQKIEKDNKNLENFKSLINKYGYNKKRNVLLLDTRITSPLFMDYLKKNGFKYIDFSQKFENSKKATTLVYDRHWNNRGRDLIAKTISEYLTPYISEKSH